MQKLWTSFLAIIFASGMAYAASTVPLGNLTDTYNNSSTVYCSWCMTISGQSYSAGSMGIQWIGGDGTDLFGMDPTGVFTFSGGTNGAWIVKCCSTSTTVLNVTANDFGIVSKDLMMTKGAATGTAPGATKAKIEVVCGTNSGTLKFQAYGGTSATPTTLLDNVGSGVQGC
jgi:hypothetical protein